MAGGRAAGLERGRLPWRWRVLHASEPLVADIRRLMCPNCQRDRGHNPGPYPAMTPEQHRASLDLLPTWVLAQKVNGPSLD